LRPSLSAAGLATESFHFYGFLSSKSRQRATQLEGLRDLDGTLVLFESSHRILSLLQQMDQLFPEHQCVIAKELTKLHEQFLCGKPRELRVLFDDDKNLTRGEFVVLIDNSHNARSRHLDIDERKILGILLEEVSVKLAVKLAAGLSGKKKNELYQLALDMSSSAKTDNLE